MPVEVRHILNTSGLLLYSPSLHTIRYTSNTEDIIVYGSVKYNVYSAYLFVDKHISTPSSCNNVAHIFRKKKRGAK